MSQLVFVTQNAASKFSGDPLKRDWNDFQHLATQGRYVSPKAFKGFQAPHYKLAAVKRQLYNPKLPSVRSMQHDDALCRLPEEHCRHTTPLTAEQFQQNDAPRSNSYMEFSGLNWHDTGKSVMGVYDTPASQREPPITFGARLRPHPSQGDQHSIENPLYRSPSVSYPSSSSSYTHPMKYAHRNQANERFDPSATQTTWPRFHMSTRTSFDLVNRMPMPSDTQNLFRSNSMYDKVSSVPWKPAGPISSFKFKRA